MRALIAYEWKKYIWSPITVLVILGMTTVLFAHLVYAQRASYQYGDLAARKSFFDTCRELPEESLKETLEVWEQDIMELFADPEADNNVGTFGKTSSLDYQFVHTALVSVTRYENRTHNVGVLLHQAEYDGNMAISTYYEEPAGVFVADGTMLEMLLQRGEYWIFAGLTVVIILGNVYCIEKKRRMLVLLETTEVGEHMVYLAKMYAGTLFAIAMAVYFFCVYVGFQCLTLRISFWQLGAPAYILTGYNFCASNLTVGSMLLLQLIMGIIVMVLLAFVTMAFSRLLPKAPFATLAAGGIFVAGVAFDAMYQLVYRQGMDTEQKFIMSEATFRSVYSMLKKWNPMALVDIEYYVSQPQYVTVGDYVLDLYVVPALVGLGVILLLGFYLRTKRNKRVV